MTKEQAIEYLQTKIADDEPVFILRAKDRVAEKTIRTWAQYYRDAGGNIEKMEAACDLAVQFGRWRAANGGGKVPD